MVYIRITSDVSYDHIYYTLDGTDPTTSSQEYTVPFPVYNNCTIKAMSVKDGWIDSNVVVMNLVVPVATPQVARIDGVTPDYCTIDILNKDDFEGTEGLKFFYTLDGTNPDPETSEWFSLGGLTVKQNGPVKILGGGDDSSPSRQIVELTVDGLQCQSPESFVWFSPEDKEAEVTLTCNTEGADIFYTLDGSTPGNQSYKYTGKFRVDHNCTLKAAADKDNLIISGVITQPIWVVLPVPSLFYKESSGIVIVSNMGSYDFSVMKIVYTLDGTEPKSTSRVYDERKGIPVTPGVTVKARAYGIQEVCSDVATIEIPEK